MPRRRLLLHHHQTAYEPEALELPEWYGRSLDALYDCLTDLSVPTTIHVENWPEEDYMQRALAVLRDAAEENELLQVRLED